MPDVKPKIKTTPHEDEVMSRSVERRLDAQRADPWRPMSDAARDGSFVYLRGDPDHDEWFWYKTRVFKRGVWEPVGFWRRRFGDKRGPEFTPDGYRRISEGLPTP